VELEMNYTIENVRPYLGDDAIVSGSEDVVFSIAVPLDAAVDNSIVWVREDVDAQQELINATKASFVICQHGRFAGSPSDKIVVQVASPKLTYSRIVASLFEPSDSGTIDPSAKIHPKAVISEGVAIGAHCSIGKVVIGAGSAIGPNTVLHDDVQVGLGVKIGSNTVIGGSGFGFAQNENQEHERFPHIGGVIIEDTVEIGSNTCVDRGSLGNTQIRRGAKVDNLVHVAHNVVIGERTLVIAQSMLGGSCQIGSDSWIAPSSCIRDTVRVGTNVTIGMGAVVTKNVPDGETWAGVPARNISKTTD
jgi:UDP-3-O-[3-hydroxymyristoyl] glucosamine N-acyltransferase